MQCGSECEWGEFQSFILSRLDYQGIDAVDLCYVENFYNLVT